jgi:DinB superfamily/Pentapeptide repeats (8 copies)
VREIHDTSEFRGARFTGVDLSGARFRNVDLTSVKMIDALMVNASFSGLIDGLRINDIEVAPLIAAEMERRYPERVQLMASDPDGVRAAWSWIEETWRATVERARGLPEAVLRQRVDEEWSFIETLRHLIFVTDGWVSRTVLGEARPYHRLGLPPTFVGEVPNSDIDTAADPSLDEVLAARHDRMASVRSLLAGISADELARQCAQIPEDGYPPETTQTVLSCLHVVFDEEWAHHQFAVRDLDTLTRVSP